jgi:deazaflavin-dependent oxidoreductase (nitroreductase family)
MSVDDYNVQIIDEFRTNGGSAPSLADMPLVLLHHKGAASGQEYVTPLAYIQDGGRYVLLASGGGRPTDPAWYRNLTAHPEVRIEVGSDTIEVVAKDASGPERDRLFDALVKRVPAFEGYVGKTTRVIPVVLLTPR